MISGYGLDQCLSFINCQVQPQHHIVSAEVEIPLRAVTLSRLAGAGAHPIAEKLAEYLQGVAGRDSCPWAIFDRNLVGKVLEDHNLPNRLARFMPEDRISEISDIMDELFGLHPSSDTLVRQVSDTVLRLAQLGNVIIIGRGANVITSTLNHVLHVRLVGSEERRLAHIQETFSFGRRQAEEYLRNEDRGRARFLKKYFDKDIDDPLLYHLVINTDLVSYEQAARLIADSVIRLAPKRVLPTAE